jgi:hypothetical protein
MVGFGHVRDGWFPAKGSDIFNALHPPYEDKEGYEDDWRCAPSMNASMFSSGTSPSTS